jgi:lipoic acid synthetase
MKNDGLIPDLTQAPRSVRKPAWLRMKRQGGADYNDVKRLLRTSSLNTVCERANCPNRGECFNSRTATFMLLGDICTRHCTFCNIPGGKVAAIDQEEPRRVAEAVRELALKFAVVTSVNRDDLPDGGAAHFAATIRQIRRQNPDCGVEVLIPDFLGDPLALETVLMAAPEVLNHNLETVPRLYRALRPQADYRRSLQLLRRSRQWADAYPADIRVKTGIMVGVGETRQEVVDLLKDAADCGTRIMTIGQYRQPTLRHHPVLRYVEPAEFDELAEIGRDLGIAWIESGPMVRSSYHAREQSDSLGGSTPSPSSRAAAG